MHIREAQDEDYGAISALMGELNPRDTVENYESRKAEYCNIIDDPSNHIFVGTIGSLIVTTCYLNIIPNITWNAAPYALIENVVTSKTHRRKGYGRRCIKHAIEYAFSRDCFKIILMSSQRNDRTRDFYGSVGLEQNKDGYVIYKNFV